MKLFRKLHSLWVDFVIFKIYIPIRWRKKIIYDGKAYIQYDDFSVVTKYRFIDLCNKYHLDWPKECELEWRKSIK